MVVSNTKSGTTRFCVWDHHFVRRPPVQDDHFWVVPKVVILTVMLLILKPMLNENTLRKMISHFNFWRGLVSFILFYWCCLASNNTREKVFLYNSYLKFRYNQVSKAIYLLLFNKLFWMCFCTWSFFEGIKFSMTKFSMHLLNLLLYYSFLIIMDFSLSYLRVDIQLKNYATKQDFNKCLSVLYCNLNSIVSNHFLNF